MGNENTKLAIQEHLRQHDPLYAETRGSSTALASLFRGCTTWKGHKECPDKLISSLSSKNHGGSNLEGSSVAPHVQAVKVTKTFRHPHLLHYVADTPWNGKQFSLVGLPAVTPLMVPVPGQGTHCPVDACSFSEVLSGLSDILSFVTVSDEQALEQQVSMGSIAPRVVFHHLTLSQCSSTATSSAEGLDRSNIHVNRWVLTDCSGSLSAPVASKELPTAMHSQTAIALLLLEALVQFWPQFQQQVILNMQTSSSSSNVSDDGKILSSTEALNLVEQYLHDILSHRQNAKVTSHLAVSTNNFAEVKASSPTKSKPLSPREDTEAQTLINGEKTAVETSPTSQFATRESAEDSSRNPPPEAEEYYEEGEFEAEVESLKARARKFYEHYAPEKLDTMMAKIPFERLVEKGQAESLIETFIRKYGPEPDSEANIQNSDTESTEVQAVEPESTIEELPKKRKEATEEEDLDIRQPSSEEEREIVAAEGPIEEVQRSFSGQGTSPEEERSSTSGLEVTPAEEETDGPAEEVADQTLVQEADEEVQNEEESAPEAERFVPNDAGIEAGSQEHVENEQEAETVGRHDDDKSDTGSVVNRTPPPTPHDEIDQGGEEEEQQQEVCQDDVNRSPSPSAAEELPAQQQSEAEVEAGEAVEQSSTRPFDEEQATTQQQMREEQGEHRKDSALPPFALWEIELVILGKIPSSGSIFEPNSHQQTKDTKGPTHNDQLLWLVEVLFWIRRVFSPASSADPTTVSKFPWPKISELEDTLRRKSNDPLCLILEEGVELHRMSDAMYGHNSPQRQRGGEPVAMRLTHAYENILEGYVALEKQLVNFCTLATQASGGAGDVEVRVSSGDKASIKLLGERTLHRVLPWLLAPQHLTQRGAANLFSLLFSSSAACLVNGSSSGESEPTTTKNTSVSAGLEDYCRAKHEALRRFSSELLCCVNDEVRISALRFLPTMSRSNLIPFVSVGINQLLPNFCYIFFDFRLRHCLPYVSPDGDASISASGLARQGAGGVVGNLITEVETFDQAAQFVILHLKALKSFTRGVLLPATIPVDSPTYKAGLLAVNEVLLPLVSMLLTTVVDMFSLASQGLGSGSGGAGAGAGAGAARPPETAASPLTLFTGSLARILASLLSFTSSLWHVPGVNTIALLYMIGHSCYYGSTESREVAMNTILANFMGGIQGAEVIPPSSTTTNNSSNNNSSNNNSSNTSQLSEDDIAHIMIPLIAPLTGERDTTIRRCSCQLLSYLLKLLENHQFPEEAAMSRVQQQQRNQEAAKKTERSHRRTPSQQMPEETERKSEFLTLRPVGRERPDHDFISRFAAPPGSNHATPRVLVNRYSTFIKSSWKGTLGTQANQGTGTSAEKNAAGHFLYDWKQANTINNSSGNYLVSDMFLNWWSKNVIGFILYPVAAKGGATGDEASQSSSLLEAVSGLEPQLTSSSSSATSTATGVGSSAGAVASLTATLTGAALGGGGGKKLTPREVAIEALHGSIWTCGGDSLAPMTEQALALCKSHSKMHLLMPQPYI